MDVSIIIPTYNRSEVLKMCLDSIDCKWLNTEIVVVDDGSSQEEKIKMKEIFSKSKHKIRLLESDHGGPARARNLALEEASGEIVLFMNDDAICGEGFVEKHWQFHIDHKEKEAALIGPFVEHPDLVDTPIMRWLTQESKMHFVYEGEWNGIMPWYYFWTCNLSVKKRFLKDNDLKFDESFPTAAWEDVEFGYRAKEKKLKIYFDKNLVCYHWHRFNYNDIFNRFFSHGRGLVHISGKVPKSDSPPLSRLSYRMTARVLLWLTLAPITVPIIKTYMTKGSRVGNSLMQYLIINEKIRGWDWEIKRLRSL